MRPLREVLRGSPNDFAIFFHRAGNTAQGLDQALACEAGGPRELAGRPLRVGVECDLKWADEGSRPLLYFHHGLTGLERLSAKEVRRRSGRGEIFTLDGLLDRPGASRLDYMVEIKRGHGPFGPAARELVRGMAQRGLAGRFMVVASSLLVLEELRRDHPDVPLGLFASHVTLKGRVLHWPKVRFWRSILRGAFLDPGELHAVDAAVGVNFLFRAPVAVLARERAARSRGVVFLPGRVTSRETIGALASEGVRGVFAYMEPSAFMADGEAAG